jgi:hypothetical protein
MERGFAGEMEEVKAATDCRGCFKCCESESERTMKAGTVGDGNVAECFGKQPVKCKYFFRFGNSLFCKCPFRVYFARGFRK